MEHATIVSVITVIGHGCPIADAGLAEKILELHSAAGGLGADIELIVVNNGAPEAAVRCLRELVVGLPNLHVYTLQKPVDHAIARLAGLENALGDWIAFVDLGLHPPAVLQSLVNGAFAGHDVVFARNTVQPRGRSLGRRLLSPLYRRLFSLLHGVDLRQEAPTFRLISRSVANAITQSDFPLVALDLLPAHGGYRTQVNEYTDAGHADHAVPFSEQVRERWRAIIGISGAPLRFANLLCAFGAVANVLYSGYVVLTYFIKEDVAPGWTTLSLQASGMFFLISIVLWLLSEYLLLVFDFASRRNPYRIVEEFSSGVQTRHVRLNVEVDR